MRWANQIRFTESDSNLLVANFFEICEWEWETTWYFTDCIILVTGLLTNAAMLWVLLREKNAFTASQVLGLNLVAMNFIYLAVTPVSLVKVTPVNVSAQSQYSGEACSLCHARDIGAMLNLIGCPLLLTCMCVERYLAVVKPVLYLNSRKWEYRMAVSCAVWCITCIFCVAMAMHTNIAAIMVGICLTECLLFQVMLACLGGLVRSLWQKSPAQASHGKHARNEPPQRRRAVVNVLAVVVPSVISYFPVLLMAPLVVCLYNGVLLHSLEVCSVVQLSQLFPNLSVFIGPLFYLSKARQTCCSERQKKHSRKKGTNVCNQ